MPLLQVQVRAINRHTQVTRKTDAQTLGDAPERRGARRGRCIACISSPYAGLIVLLFTEFCFYRGNTVGWELESPLHPPMYQSHENKK